MDPNVMSGEFTIASQTNSAVIQRSPFPKVIEPLQESESSIVRLDVGFHVVP